MQAKQNKIQYIMLQIPTEIIQDICHYLNPDRLHMLARHSAQTRYIVNGMDRGRYIEKWLDLENKTNKYVYKLSKKYDKEYYKQYGTKYGVGYDVIDDMKYKMGYGMVCDMICILDNYWYFKLECGDDTFDILKYGLERIDFMYKQKYKSKNTARYKYLHIRFRSNISVFRYGIFRALHNVHSLDLSCQDIRDVSGLGGVYNLDISYCNRVKDISMLGGVHTLNIFDCPYIEDISMLDSVYKLKVLSYPMIYDVSALGNLHTINLSGGYNIKDVSTLGNVHNLNLSFCIALTDAYICMLANVYKLDITMTKITDKCIPMLSNVNTLSLSTCNKFTDVSTLGAIKNLYMPHTNIEDVSALGGVDRLYLSYCQKIRTDVGILGSVSELSLQGCEWVTDVNKLQNVHTLILIKCKNLTIDGISKCTNVNTLDIRGCENIANIDTYLQLFKNVVNFKHGKFLIKNYC